MTNKQDITALEQAIADAHRTLDACVLEALYHPDFLLLQPDGAHEGKADVIAAFRSGERAWQSAEVDEIEVRLAGDTAVAVGRWRARGRNRDVEFDYAARFLSVWAREGERWRNLAYTATEIV